MEQRNDTQDLMTRNQNHKSGSVTESSEESTSEYESEAEQLTDSLGNLIV